MTDNQWDYEIIQTYPHNPQQVLERARKMGLDGWELVGPIGYTLYFKRPIEGAAK